MRTAVLAIAALGLLTADPPKQLPPRPQGELLSVSAIRLHTAYVENPVLADSKYKDQWVRVVGQGAVLRGREGENVYAFGTLSVPEKRPHAWDWGVYAFIETGQEKEFAREFKDGDQVEVEGVCLGSRSLRSAHDGIIVTLEKCRLVKFIPFRKPAP